MSVVVAGEVRGFILAHLAGSIQENEIPEGEITEDFDLMERGIIDSIGFIHLVSAIEEHFGIEVDFEDMDTEVLTILGSICRYIEERAEKR